MRRQCFKPFSFDNKMQMGRAEWMAPHLGEHFAHGSIIGDGIEFGPHGVEPVAAFIIRSKDATQIEIGLMPLLLNVIEPIVICLPNIDLSVWDRGPIGCQYGSFHQHGIAFLVEANVVSKLKFRDVGQMKWTEDR